METKLDPRADARRLKDDWGARAFRVKDQAPNWTVVMVDTRSDRTRGRAAFAREQLRRYGVEAEVQSMKGDGSRMRPWQGWVTFAKLKI